MDVRSFMAFHWFWISGNDAKTHHINEKAICRAKISQLLRAAVKFEYDTFKKTLQQILPIGIEFKVVLHLYSFSNFGHITKISQLLHAAVKFAKCFIRPSNPIG